MNINSHPAKKLLLGFIMIVGMESSSSIEEISGFRNHRQTKGKVEQLLWILAKSLRSTKKIVPIHVDFWTSS